MNPTTPNPRNVIMTAWEIARILDGSKTQLRRYVMPQPPADYQQKNDASFGQTHHQHWMNCPLGEAGALLWVQERFTLEDFEHCDGIHSCKVRYEDGTLGGRIPLPEGEIARVSAYTKQAAPAMPRWASRLTLQILDTKLCRLLEMTEHDAKQEGFYRTGTTALNTVGMGDGRALSARENYRLWWDTRYSELSFAEDNPWVWALTVKVAN